LSKEAKSLSQLAGLGRVAGARGLKGAVKVRAEADTATTDPEVIMALGEVEIGGRSYRVLGAERLKTQMVLHLEGVSTRSQAEALVGQKVRGDARRFPPLPPGEYYWFQLLGLPVFDAQAGNLLGHLEEIIPTAANDVYVVRSGTREVLFPAVEEVITEINLEEGFLKVTPPAGLLEAYAD
jgi:16S rRNA processing protein RimM